MVQPSLGGGGLGTGGGRAWQVGSGGLGYELSGWKLCGVVYKEKRPNGACVKPFTPSVKPSLPRTSPTLTLQHADISPIRT